MMCPYKILFQQVATKYKEIQVLIYRHRGIAIELDGCSLESDVTIKDKFFLRDLMISEVGFENTLKYWMILRNDSFFKCYSFLYDGYIFLNKTPYL